MTNAKQKSKPKAKHAKPKPKPNPKAQRDKAAAKHKLPTWASMLSPCVQEYIETLADPSQPSGACIPLPPSFPSEKLHVWSKGYFTSGSTAYTGFIFANPWLMAANDATAIYVGSTSYAGSTFAPSGTGITTQYSNSPYILSQFNNAPGNVRQRLVSACIRVKFVGHSTYDGGSIVGMTHPDHFSMNGMSATDMERFPGVSAHGTNRNKWYTVNYSPTNSTELDYSGVLDYFSDETATHHCMGIMLQGLSSTNLMACEWEVHSHFELMGATSRAKTPNSPDIVGGTATVEYFTSNMDAKIQSAKQAIEGVARVVAYGSSVGRSLYNIWQHAGPTANRRRIDYEEL